MVSMMSLYILLSLLMYMLSTAGNGRGRILYAPVVPAAEHLPYSVPLVDKTPSIRASLRVAASSALANALNMASSLWWSFSP